MEVRDVKAIELRPGHKIGDPAFFGTVVAVFAHTAASLRIKYSDACNIDREAIVAKRIQVTILNELEG